MKDIRTVPQDIYNLLEGGKLSEEGIERFGESIKELLKNQFTEDRKPPALRMSNAGEPCERKLWYKVNAPSDGEPLTGQTLHKFLYGHLIEELDLFLAQEAGHSVEGRQDELEIEGIKGHRDCILDGVVCDVKSASSYGFQKFKNHGVEQDDPFGYMAQLSSYVLASQEDVRVKIKKQGAFLAIDKVSGEIAVDIYDFNPELVPDYEAKKEMLGETEPPDRAFKDQTDGLSGNKKLGINCSYCDFKKTCWPGLRSFAYAGKAPVHLTKVVREPSVPEITDPSVKPRAA